MTKFHINPKTGNPGKCSAQSDNCPFGGESEHFPTAAEARKVYENLKTQQTFKRLKVDKSISEEENLILTEKLYNEHNDLIKMLTKEEENAIRWYSFTGSSMINRLLHGKSRPTDISHPGDEESIWKTIRSLDSAIAKSKDTEVKKLYRYITLEPGEKPQERLEKITSQNTYKDSGFMSTTEDISFISAYSHKNISRKMIILEIETAKGVSLQKSEKEELGHLQSFEKERLLPRDLTLTVLDSGKTTVNIDESRKKLREQFAGSHLIDWSANLKEIGKIPRKSFFIVRLKDESC